MKIRYAVAGLGYISQIAVLPAFRNAAHNSELCALISGDPAKRRKLAREYGVECVGSYDDFEQCLDEAKIDAVYIATPNARHSDLAVRAARLGVHVLCEKPLAESVVEAQRIVTMARQSRIKLMTAYRLHFDAATLDALKIAHSHRLGELKFFVAEFSMQVKRGNVRLSDELGGGPLFDLGIYPINAARALFGSEPTEVIGTDIRSNDRRFKEVEETHSAILKFPGGKTAILTASFGATETSFFEIVGTKGRLRLDPAFDFATSLRHELTIDGKTSTKTYKKRDQFAPELIYFSDCIINNLAIEPSGEEGLSDVRIIEALHRSALTGQWEKLSIPSRNLRPSSGQKMSMPSVSEPELFRAERPSVH